jgi:Predicted transcription factor, homolog of eukaryotic MBF1
VQRERRESMDSKKFGEFIATIRKEKGWTQAELAKKLSVTDKAVSRWERGLGFPDINTVKPLADALDVSVLEIMQSEKEPEEDIPMNRATEVLDNMISLVVYQRDIERRNITISVVSVISIVFLIFLIDIMNLEAFIFVCMPFVFLATGVVLIVLSIHRHRMKLSYYVTLILGILALLFPLIICLILFFAFALGGPVPN